MNLQDLIKRIEAADGPSRELDVEIHRSRGKYIGIPKYTSSIDAAMTLVPDGQFGTRVVLNADASGGALCWDKRGKPFAAKAKTPALALCAAALRAVMAKNEG